MNSTNVTTPGAELDCSGRPGNIAYLGDGTCNLGRIRDGAIEVDYNCQRFSCDEGDCDADSDGICDAGIVPHWTFNSNVGFWALVAIAVATVIIVIVVVRAELLKQKATNNTRGVELNLKSQRDAEEDTPPKTAHSI